MRDIRNCFSTPLEISSTLLALLAFFIVVIVAAQLHAAQSGKSGIVFHTKELRQHGLSNHFCKRLAFIFSALALAFQSMANHFMEEYCCGASGKQRRSIERLNYRRFLQLLQVLRDLFHLGRNFLL